MPVLHVDSVDAAHDALGNAPSPVVIVPVYNGFEDVVRCYESLFEHTPQNVAILVVDDRGLDRRTITILDEIDANIRHHVVVLGRRENGGFTRACNDGFEAADGRDVVVVNSDVVVGPEWLTRLTDAASASSLIGTATTLTNHGTILSLPVRNTPDKRPPGGMTTSEAARRVAANSLRLRPTIPTAIGHCMYIKRALIEQIGGFDEAFGTGYAEEVDFSQQAVKLGFRHVCADDVFTYHRGGASFGTEALAQKERNEALINLRYPWFPHWMGRASTDRFSPLALAIDRARVAIVGLSIGVDATMVGSSSIETQGIVVETIGSLATLTGEHGEHGVLVYHTDRMGRDVQRVIDAVPRVERVNIGRDELAHAPDVLYRPCAVNSLDELRWLRRHGRRVIVNQLDTMAWSNPSYFPSDRAWANYRDLTRLTLSCVDGIAFPSDFVRRELADEGMIPAGAPTGVVHCGATNQFARPDAESRPAGFDDNGIPFLLLVGAAYHHNNRLFAVRLLVELHRRGWDGRLVIAGPVTPMGASVASESAARLKDPILMSRVVTLGELTEPEQNWLYSRAALSLYPAAPDGRGLVVFESALRKVPVLTSRQGSLDEILPRDIPTLDGYDVARAADQVSELLKDQAAASWLCDRLNAHSGQFTWERTARELLALFEDVLRRAPNRVTAVWSESARIDLEDVLAIDAPSEWAGRVEGLLQRVLRAETLKRAAIPVGSRRQQVARRTVNWARRQSGIR